MFIGIIGAGAVGCALGALLRRGNHDVILIGRPDQVEAIRRDGLRVEGCLGEFTVHPEAAVTFDTRPDEAYDLRPDLAFLTVKTQDVVPALETYRAHLVGVPVVTVQNGVRSDDLAAGLIPRSQIMSAVVVGLAANYLTHGHIEVAQRGSLAVGRPFGPRDPDVEEVARMLNEVIPTAVSDNVRGAHWLKLILNLNNAIPAMTGRPMPEIAEDEDLIHLSVGMMREGLRVAHRAGVELEPLPGTPVGLFRLMERLPMALAARLFSARVRRMERRWPIIGSTAQSILRRRPTEIEYLNGEIVRTGAEVGEPTPLNAAAVDIVRSVERTGRFLTLEEVRGAMGETHRRAA